MRVAVAGYGGSDEGEGLAAAAGLAAEAADAEARLLVLPARFFTVPDLCDGETARAMRELAREHRLGIAYGYLELDAQAHHDSLLFIDDEGCCRTNYRRVHHTRAEMGQLVRGQWFSVMPFAGRRLGFMIGHDIAFPEQARALRLAGVDLLVALDRAGGAGPGGTVLHAARAAENGCELILAGGGPEAAGLFDAQGRHQAGTGRGALRLVDLGPPGSGVATDALLLERRPRLYQRLLAEVERPA